MTNPNGIQVVSIDLNDIDKIPLIKLIRELSKDSYSDAAMGLKEAKDFVDEIFSRFRDVTLAERERRRQLFDIYCPMGGVFFEARFLAETKNPVFNFVDRTDVMDASRSGIDMTTFLVNQESRICTNGDRLSVYLGIKAEGKDEMSPQDLARRIAANRKAINALNKQQETLHDEIQRDTEALRAMGLAPYEDTEF